MGTNIATDITKIAVDPGVARQKKVSAKPVPAVALRRTEAVQPEVNTEEIKRVVEQMIKEFGLRSTVNMYYDEDAKRVVVTVREQGTDRVIRQIPAPEFLNIVKRFKKTMGMIINRQV